MPKKTSIIGMLSKHPSMTSIEDDDFQKMCNLDSFSRDELQKVNLKNAINGNDDDKLFAYAMKVAIFALKEDISSIQAITDSIIEAIRYTYYTYELNDYNYMQLRHKIENTI